MKFSFIIPVYNPNLELFNNMLESILKQTYTNFEVILVDDGSSNGCEKVYNFFNKKDNRIKVFKKQNEGVSVARNFGILKSTGDWLIFVDSDDIVLKDTCEIFYNALNNEKTIDLIIAKTIIQQNNKSELSFSKYKENKYISKNELISSIFLVKNGNNVSFTYCGAVWAKCFNRKKIIDNKILFNEDVVIGEDALFNVEYINKCEKIYFINNCVYTYVVNFESAMKSYSEKILYSNKILKKCLEKYFDTNIICNDDLHIFNIRQLINSFELNLFHELNSNSFSKNKKLYLENLKLYKLDIKMVNPICMKKEYILLIIFLKIRMPYIIIKYYFKIINYLKKVKYENK